MKLMVRSAILASAFFLFLAIEADAQTISGSIGSGVVERGKSVRGTIVMSIPGGLHVNSYKPDSEYAIPTTVRITSPGVRVSGLFYPQGKKRKFEFSEERISVYEGTVRFPFTITVPEGFRGRTLRVRAVVHYQACTEEVCYPPRSKDITLTARVL